MLRCQFKYACTTKPYLLTQRIVVKNISRRHLGPLRGSSSHFSPLSRRRLNPIKPVYDPDQPGGRLNLTAITFNIQVSARSGTRLPVALLHITDTVPGRPLLCSAESNKLLVPRSCTTSFGLRSFSSSGPTAWNDMPAHLRNLDLSPSDFRQLLKTALFQTVPV